MSQSIRKFMLSLIVGLSFALQPLAANAVVIYDFEGICPECVGGVATAVLTLDDTYSPGDVPTLSQLLGFTYTSSNVNDGIIIPSRFPGSIVVPGDDDGIEFFSGALPSSGSAPAAIQIQFGPNDVGSGIQTLFFDGLPQSDTNWFVSFLLPGPFASDAGPSHTWTLRANVVPVPAALPLFGTGLGVLGFFGWLRRRRSAAV